MATNDNLGKAAEKKIKEWLDRPDDGYSFDRLYDQMTGFYMTSRNICDFICYKSPNIYYIESKATELDRFEFSRISEFQFEGLMKKASIPGCYGWVIVLFALHKRAFKFDIRDIKESIDSGKKSVNIKKIDRWTIPYKEISTIPNSRKVYLDYVGELDDLM